MLCECNIVLLLTKWFMLICCDTFEEQIPCKLNMQLFRKFLIKSLPYFTLGKCLIELVRDGFDICKIQGECPLDCNLLSIILHPFLFMSFSFGVSHRNIFNEAISIQGYMSYLLFFPTGVFGRKICRTY